MGLAGWGGAFRERSSERSRERSREEQREQQREQQCCVVACLPLQHLDRAAQRLRRVPRVQRALRCLRLLEFHAHGAHGGGQVRSIDRKAERPELRKLCRKCVRHANIHSLWQGPHKNENGKGLKSGKAENFSNIQSLRTLRISGKPPKLYPNFFLTGTDIGRPICRRPIYSLIGKQVNS
jgi:hypothetical protein